MLGIVEGDSGIRGVGEVGSWGLAVVAGSGTELSARRWTTTGKSGMRRQAIRRVLDMGRGYAVGATDLERREGRSGAPFTAEASPGEPEDKPNTYRAQAPACLLDGYNGVTPP